MSIANRNIGTGIRQRRMAAVIVMLCLCFQMALIPTASAESLEPQPDYNGMTLKDIKAEAKKNEVKLLDKDAYLAMGWLLREGKIEVTEEGKDLFIKLI